IGHLWHTASPFKIKTILIICFYFITACRKTQEQNNSNDIHFSKTQPPPRPRIKSEHAGTAASFYHFFI
ncbi:MAG: hypothetical protein ACLUEJ_12970, partial [Clostridium sp.]